MLFTVVSSRFSFAICEYIFSKQTLNSKFTFKFFDRRRSRSHDCHRKGLESRGLKRSKIPVRRLDASHRHLYVK